MCVDAKDEVQPTKHLKCSSEAIVCRRSASSSCMDGTVVPREGAKKGPGSP